LPKLIRAFFCAQREYPASDELANFPTETLMLVSCWSRSPVDSTVRDGMGALASRWPRCWLARPARPARDPCTSSDPRLVSGGDVLVQVDAPREDASISIDLNGHDITGGVRRDAGDRCN